jgi:two-component system cell cycle sensor histidine kinase/response regulator CckA
VLLVEDEKLVRQLATRVLQEQGYTVLEVSNEIEALELFKESEGIDILLTDVIMPVMGGRELSERIRELRPDIKVLYISGYTDDAIIRFGMLPPGTAFAEKPFSATALAVKVRQVLDES